MSIIAIAAVDENWGIGYNGELLEHIPEDLRRFKELTENKIVVMGKKTQESLPNKKLSNRINIVLTSQDLGDEDKVFYTGALGLEYILSFSQIYEMGYDRWQSFTDRKMPNLKDIYIIGGASVYKQWLPYCDKLYLTHIYKKYDNVDAYFPEVNEAEWEIESASELKEYNGIQYSFIDYKRAKT